MPTETAPAVPDDRSTAVPRGGIETEKLLAEPRPSIVIGLGVPSVLKYRTVPLKVVEAGLNNRIVVM
jgi:hypothetical protein